MFLFEAAGERRPVAEVAQSVTAVEFGGVFPVLDKRTVDAGVDGHIALHDFEDGQHIGIDHADVYIAGQGGDGEHIDIRVAKGEHNCLRVIDAGVCINNQLHFLVALSLGRLSVTIICRVV